ncbi:MAG: hypothetical protein QM796_12940 [Chthoniobacteraceae bacterium]
MQAKHQKFAIAALAALGAITISVMAQSASPTPTSSPSNSPGDGRPHPHHPPSPLVMALDVNKDGVIDATEIANAAAELKTLDKNGDGQLTPDEFGPPHRGFGGPGGPDGQGSGAQDAPPPAGQQ